MAIINSIKINFWERCREKGILLYYWQECKFVQSLWKTVLSFLKKLKYKNLIQQFHSWLFLQMKMKTQI